jgi:hypothetical protein
MKRLKLSGFDLGVVIVFSVLTVMGIAAWWFLSGSLQDAVTAAQAAKTNFDKYSSAYHFVVSKPNAKVLQANIDLLKAQLDPLIKNQLVTKENQLHAKSKEDPVAWKHDLEDEIHRLSAAAKLHSVALPANFYFGFTRYQGQNPGDAQTVVLSKQLLGVEQLASILIKANVNNIKAIRRTYEEDPHTQSADTNPAAMADGDHLPGSATIAAGGDYTAYPFELDFESTTENLRPVIDGIIQAPYVFVIRAITVENSVQDSPKISDLDRMAGSSSGASPGDTSQTKGTQFLFGLETLRVKLQVDMIEWNADTKPSTPHK